MYIWYFVNLSIFNYLLGFDDPLGLKIDQDYRQYEKLCQRKEILLKQLMKDFQLLR